LKELIENKDGMIAANEMEINELREK